MPTQAGYVYLFAAGEPCDGYYKIGKASDPRKRIKSFTLLPFKVDMLHFVFCEDVFNAESCLHRFFKHSRVNGEWFRLSPDEVKVITSIHKESDILALVQDFEPVVEFITRVIRLPDNLYKELVETSEQDNRSLNGEIITLLQEAIDARKKNKS